MARVSKQATRRSLARHFDGRVQARGCARYGTDEAENQPGKDSKYLSGTQRRLGGNSRRGERLLRRVRQRQASLDCCLDDGCGRCAVDGRRFVLGPEQRKGSEDDRDCQKSFLGRRIGLHTHGRIAAGIGRGGGDSLYYRRTGAGVARLGRCEGCALLGLHRRPHGHSRLDNSVISIRHGHQTTDRPESGHYHGGCQRELCDRIGGKADLGDRGLRGEPPRRMLKMAVQQGRRRSKNRRRTLRGTLRILAS